MSATRRVQQQSGFILHHRPFRDTSQLLDVFAREHGKIALVARGSRAAKSKLRGVLRPFQPLKLSWYIRSDLGTLTGAEIDGGPISLTGDALLSAYYVNELVLHFLHRHDPQPEIFGVYDHTIRALASSASLAMTLRDFEIELLRMLGYALNLECDAVDTKPLDDDCYYEYRVEQGPVQVSRTQGPMVFSGRLLKSIHSRSFDDKAVLRGAGRLLRVVIDHHLAGKELRTRKVLRELHRGKIAPQPDK
jgi:DNA repair protein RecO (recombination protein O)